MQNMNQSPAEIQVLNTEYIWTTSAASSLNIYMMWFSNTVLRSLVIFFNYYFLLLTQLLVLASHFSFFFCLLSSSCCCRQNLNNRQFKYNRFYEADRLQHFTELTEINRVIPTTMKKIRLMTFWWRQEQEVSNIQSIIEHNQYSIIVHYHSS